MRVSINSAPSTRAASFQDGTEKENKADNVILRFYDASGNPISGITYQTVDKSKLEDNWTGSTGNVGAIREAVMELSIPRGEAYPVYVMCYINPVNYSADGMSTSSMYELRNQTRDGFLDDGGNFAMTNAAYYGNNAYTGAQQVKMSATPILGSQLYTTATEAAAAQTPVDIYVERYAAKVQFSLDKTGIQDQTQGDYTLTFNSERWSVNADANEMYVVKRFSDSDKDTDVIPSYNDVQATLPGWTSWNDAANHRSYWACSPGFYAEDFPQVSDEIIDIAPAGTGAGVVVAPYSLRYYSYNQMTDANLKSEGFGVLVADENATSTKYVLENTMGKAAFNCANPKAAAPSVVVLGNYTIKRGDTSITNADGFCLFNGNLYWRETIPAEDLENGRTIKDAMLDENSILFVTEEIGDGSLLNSKNAAALADLFDVVHPSKEVRALQGNPTPHRYVALQLKKDQNYTGLYYRPQGTDNRVPVTADAVDWINLQLWSQIGIARAYTHNKGYFSIPIQHLGFTENANGEPVTDGAIDWRNKVRVGDFGLVRNHVYDIKVSAIEGMASGIENLDNPLVPSMEDNLRNVKFQINILNWRIVPSQSNIVLK